MNENHQEENSVDILKDDTGNSNSQDSFNKDLQKIYEEHKKSETKVPHRPISSYTANRNFNQANKEMDPVKQVKNKPQSAQATKSNNNSKNSNSKDQHSKNNEKNSNNNKNENNNNDIGIEDLLNDLNNFLSAHKIKKSDFIDNPNVFLTFEDFTEIFKQIHYTLPKKYLKVLFDYNNPEGAKENYVLMANFIKNLTFYKIEGIGNDSDISKMENYSLSNSKNSNHNTKTITEALDKKSNKSIYELKYINEQYNQFNKDIIDILRNSKKSSYQNTNPFGTFNKKAGRGKNIGS